MDFLKDLSPEELVFLSSTIAVTLAKGLTKRETLVLYQFFNAVAKDIHLIAFQKIDPECENKLNKKI